MGRGIIITVLGVSVITAFLILKLNANSKQGLKTTVDYYELTQARLIANSGVEIYLEKLRRDKTLTGTFSDIGLMDGKYDLSITGPDSLMTVTSTGHFGNTNHQVIVTAKREPAIMPPVNGSLYISADTLAVKLQGNLEIDGNAAVPGIAVDDPADSSYVINELIPNISNNIEGLGGDPSVHTVVDNTDWDEVTQNLIFAQDTSLGTGNYSAGTVLGTFANPIITYVYGDVHFSSTATGSGIMIIDGDVTMSGQFTFYGMIIVYGNSSIETTFVGNGGIYGTIIMVGSKVDFKSTGTTGIYYSSQAISNAQVNLKSSRFEILSWWE